MENKGLKIAILSALLIGSIMLCKRGNKLSSTTKITGKFEVSADTGNNTSQTVVFWIEDGKYWSQPKADNSVKSEITKSEYEKNHTSYLN